MWLMALGDDVFDGSVKFQRGEGFTRCSRKASTRNPDLSFLSSSPVLLQPVGIFHSSVPSPYHSIFCETHCAFQRERGYFGSALMGPHGNREMMADSCPGKTPVTGDTLCGPSRLLSQRGPGNASCWGREATLQRKVWTFDGPRWEQHAFSSPPFRLSQGRGKCTVVLGPLLCGS